MADEPGDLSKDFHRESSQPAWQDKTLRGMSNDDLEQYREVLANARDKPEAVQEMRMGGEYVKLSQEQAAEWRESMIRRIDGELLHRLMKEREREGRENNIGREC